MEHSDKTINLYFNGVSIVVNREDLKKFFEEQGYNPELAIGFVDAVEEKR